MKLLEKTRIGSQLKRCHNKPHTPLERLLNCPRADPAKIQKPKNLRDSTDPFELAKRLEQKLERIYQMANYRISATLKPPQPSSQPSTRAEQ